MGMRRWGVGKDQAGEQRQAEDERTGTHRVFGLDLSIHAWVCCLFDL
jgi:hypothetical protein